MHEQLAGTPPDAKLESDASLGVLLRGSKGQNTNSCEGNDMFGIYLRIVEPLDAPSEATFENSVWYVL